MTHTAGKRNKTVSNVRQSLLTAVHCTVSAQGVRKPMASWCTQSTLASYGAIIYQFSPKLLRDPDLDEAWTIPYYAHMQMLLHKYYHSLFGDQCFAILFNKN